MVWMSQPVRPVPGGLDSLHACWVYQGAIRGALQRFKYSGRDYLAGSLSRYLVNRIRDTEELWECEMVVPVPLHSARRRKRDFNQSEELSRRVAGYFCWTHAPLALSRIRATPPQVGMTRAERLGNMEGAFAPGTQAGLAAGKPVLLVDDVATTGATLGAAGQALRTLGAAAVHGLVLAHGDQWVNQ